MQVFIERSAHERRLNVNWMLFWSLCIEMRNDSDGQWSVCGLILNINTSVELPPRPPVEDKDYYSQFIVFSCSELQAFIAPFKLLNHVDVTFPPYVDHETFQFIATQLHNTSRQFALIV